ncbi:Hypothetical protein FKW44_004416 [Caligus rogercresseyi]|uniref:Uncharacterized protein n=1 Tax=Caligus rogercresseyi TaxID=217165 RepID=A0A7T8K9W9_CALRO|nr:Hypothetical protein FKW44_004416 [Caligus rogercresseyi]
MPLPALYRPKYTMGGCQRPFMFLEASDPTAIVPVLPLATSAPVYIYPFKSLVTKQFTGVGKIHNQGNSIN